MIHSFDVDMATKYGLLESILFYNISYWVQKNQANEKNFFDGDYWTYNSTSAFSKLFPYTSKRKIEIALKNLRDNGLIKTGNYNENKYDRTLWYSIGDVGRSILRTGDMDVTNRSLRSDVEVTPIPNSKTISKPDCKPEYNITPYNPPEGEREQDSMPANTKPSKRKKESAKEDYDLDGFDAFYAAYPRHEGKAAALKAWNKLKPDIVLQTKMGAALNVQKQSQQWIKNNGQYIPMPSTWLNGKRWEDESPQNQSSSVWDNARAWAREQDQKNGDF